MQTEVIDLEVGVEVPAGDSCDSAAGPRASVSSPGVARDLIPASMVSSGEVGVMLGIIVALTGCEPLVQFSGGASSSPVRARTIVPLTDQSIGRQVVLGFEKGDMANPIVLGLIQSTPSPANTVAFQADGERFLVVAERQIELRCGEASITLTRAGKVLIQGEYVLTRAKGINRIKGAAVEIN